jgi:hypothetical protein
MAVAPVNLQNARVRIVLRRHFREMPVDIMRGIVTDTTEVGLTISGRHFQEMRDNVSGEYEERPLTKHTKVYFIPHASIKYVDVIQPASREAEIGDKIERRNVLESPVKEYTFSAKSGRSAK